MGKNANKIKNANAHAKRDFAAATPRGPRKISLPGYKFMAKNSEQSDLNEGIKNNSLSFALGPAGTGKTHIGVVRAVKAFENGEVSRIILCRPAVHGGEDLGFLPGSADDKVGPYMQPLFDELKKVIGRETLKEMRDSGEIEIIPLAFMRGRTLEDTFVVLDEAQNTTDKQMEMVLTRMGQGSKIVISGDQDQNDLPADIISGLDRAVTLFTGKNAVHVTYLHDVVRSDLAQLAVDTYAAANKAKKSAPTTKKTRHS